jgi:hypothetical protein
MEGGSPTSEMLMDMSSDELKAHVAQLNILQESLTSAVHIRRVDSLIPAAVQFAKKKAGGNSTLRSEFFVQEMNRLTCEAGLRCC